MRPAGPGSVSIGEAEMRIDFGIAIFLVCCGWLVVTLVLARSLGDPDKATGGPVRVGQPPWPDPERGSKPIPANRAKALPRTPAT
jgi:hypothetical protein